MAWELDNGPIPEGLTIDHVRERGCRHRNCCNVSHLEPVTMAENNRRSDSITAANALKTHCDHGHEFTEVNTYRRRNGSRECWTCKRAIKRRHAQNNPEAVRAARRKYTPPRRPAQPIPPETIASLLYAVQKTAAKRAGGSRG